MKTLTMQLPDSLYSKISQIAVRENLSLDQFITIAVSAQVSAWITKDYLRERSERGSWEKFQKVPEKVPDIEPEEYDKL